MSKTLKSFKIGDEIPSNAKFIHASPNRYGGVSYVYEVSESPKASKNKQIKEDEINATIERVITYLNKKVGGRYTTKAKATTSKIRARINEGAQPEDFKKCIDSKCKEWLDDPKWSKFLRPETLFSEKFWNYISGETQEDKADKALEELEGMLDAIGDSNA